LRLYRATEPVVLSDILPMLEHLGLRVVAEEPFRIDCTDGSAVWIDEFQLSGAAIAGTVTAAAGARFEEALGALDQVRVPRPPRAPRRAGPAPRSFSRTRRSLRRATGAERAGRSGRALFRRGPTRSRRTRRV